MGYGRSRCSCRFNVYFSLRKANNVIGAVGLVENMPDGNAQRPGDIVESLSGQTIEVLILMLKDD